MPNVMWVFQPSCIGDRSYFRHKRKQKIDQVIKNFKHELCQIKNLAKIMKNLPSPPSELQYFYQLEILQQNILSQSQIPATEAKLAAILNIILASYYADPLGCTLFNELAEYLLPFSQQAFVKVQQDLKSEKQ